MPVDQKLWLVPASGRDPILGCLCRLCERGSPDPSGSAAVEVLIRGGSRLARTSSIMLPAGHPVTPLSSPCGRCLSEGGHNMVIGEEGQMYVKSGRVASAIRRHTGGDGAREKILSAHDIIREAYSHLPAPSWRNVSTQTAPPCVPPRPDLLISFEWKQGDGGGYHSGFSRKRMGLPVCRMHALLSNTNGEYEDLD